MAQATLSATQRGGTQTTPTIAHAQAEKPTPATKASNSVAEPTAAPPTTKPLGGQDTPPAEQAGEQAAQEEA